MIYLMDMGTHFEMIYRKQRVVIEYGEYSLALANIDFDGVQNTIQSYLDVFTTQFELATTLGYLEPKHADKIGNYKQYGIYPNAVKTDIIKNINSTLYKPLSEFLDNGYLNKKQLKLATMLIISELENSIKSDTFNWQEETTYIPSILIHKELRNQLENILLRDSTPFSTEIQKNLSQKIISSVINIDKNGTARTTFLIEDTLAFMMIDLQKYLTGTKTVLRCQNPKCNRLFYPKSGNNKWYCRLKHKDTDKLCNEIMHLKPTDDFAKLAKKARGAQGGFVNNAKAHKNNPKFHYDYNLLDKEYEKWQRDCSTEMEHFRLLNDIKGYITWISDTRFTVKKLEQLGIRKRVLKSTAKEK